MALSTSNTVLSIAIGIGGAFLVEFIGNDKIGLDFEWYWYAGLGFIMAGAAMNQASQNEANERAKAEEND